MSDRFEEHHRIKGFLKFPRGEQDFARFDTRFNDVRAVFVEFYQSRAEFSLEQILNVCLEKNLSRVDSFVFISHLIQILKWMGMIASLNKTTFKRIVPAMKGSAIRKQNAEWLNWVLGAAEIDLRADQLEALSV
jgi:hypothetical protein